MADGLEPHRALIERTATAIGPALPPEPPRPAESEPDGDEFDLRELWQVIVKRRWTIAIFTLIVVKWS